jgi:hypothetical protein
VTLQAFVPSDPTRLLFFRVTDSASADATDLTNAAGFVGNGGTIGIDTEPSTQLYLQWALFTSAGVAATGGALDAVYVTVEV